MSATRWAYGLLGLFLSWLVFYIVPQVFGFTIGLFNNIETDLTNLGITIPQEFQDLRNTVTNDFTKIWGWMGLIVFFSFIVYIILSSMRRQPADMIE